MCPGIAVLAGGGDGGGGSGKGSKGGKGKKKGKTSKKNKNAKGGKKSGKKAKGSGKGKGKGCKCPKCNSSQSRGDPVDVVTGRAFTSPVVDINLPGPLPLVIERGWSATAHDRDIGLGYGWSHSLAWEVEVFRRFIRVWTDDGRAIDFEKPPIGEATIGEDGWLLRQESWGWLLDCNDDQWLAFSAAEDGGKRYRLTAIEDRNHNRIALTYDGNKLVEVVDSAGRIVRFTATTSGRIGSIEIKNAKTRGQWIPFVTYSYDDRGDLVAVTDADGQHQTFTYDHEHLLTSHTDAIGLTFHFLYDSQHRCTETWGNYPGGRDESLGDDLPEFLADGLTRAKGVHHVRVLYGPDGYSEVTTARQTERFQGNDFGKADSVINAGGVTTRTFDEQGNVTSVTDPIGGVTQWEYDARGRPVRKIDALGHRTLFKRDASGRVVERINENGQVWRGWYDRFGNMETMQDPLGAVSSFKYDSRGLVTEVVDPNGHRTTFDYDTEGNLITLTRANGAVWRATYDAFGRQLSLTNPLGHTETYAYSDTGELLSVVGNDGGIRRFSYDGVGHLVSVIDPDGMMVKLRWGGYDSLVAVEKPNGSSFAMRYDREGELVQLINERGEVHRFAYNAQAFKVWERHFDGREQRYTYDALGKLVRYENGVLQATEFEYDLEGNLIERRYADDAETFEYSPTGEIIAATNGAGSWRLERDACDRIIRETQTFGGHVHDVNFHYDAIGQLIELRTSLGHVKGIQRDAIGRPARLTLDGVGYDIGNDAMGREVERRLAPNVSIESAFDAVGQLVSRRVTSPTVHRATNEPEWMGEARSAYTVETRYQYGPGGDLLQAWDKIRGLTQFKNDPLGRLVAKLPEALPAETFAWDNTNNLHETGPGGKERVYGSGNQLLRRGDTEYRWNDDGQLVRRERPANDTGEIEAWEYEWAGSGLLQAITKPDGTRLEYSYDPFFRRVAKRVVPRPLTDQSARETLFVWEGNRLLHEVRARASGDDVVERTYCFEDTGFAPWAHRDVSRDSEGTPSGEWFHYVNDPTGATDRLVDHRGEVVCSLERTAWGRATVADETVTDTPLRLLGQYEDDESGLFYNRFRYYDPDTARYISADPLGVGAGNNEFRYAPNPMDWVDPWGLISANTAALGAAMALDGRPCADHETPHHIVQRNGDSQGHKDARAVLDRNGIKLDSAANGARLKGAAKSQRKKGGHEKACEGYHGGGDIHGAEAQAKIARQLEAAETAAGGKGSPGAPAAVEAKLREIGAMQELTKQGNR